MITLRPYQAQAVQSVEQALERGVRRQLMVLPTGGGKTIVFSEIVRRRCSAPVLILAHRDELLTQARDKLISVAPELAMSTGMVKAKHNDVGAPVVIASIQTLARKRRRDQLPTNFGTVIIDECHHSEADSYQAVLDHVQAELVLGVTATPERHDGKSLERSFDELVFARSIEEMITEGYLCPPKGVRITVDVDFDQVKKSHGDFQADALADALEEAGTPAEVLRSYLDHGENRKGLIFAPSVDMAHHMAEVFRGSGIPAEALDGTTPAEERAGILHRLHTGETQIVSNVGVLTEGFDEPSVSCIILAAPTKSRGRYTQIIGRGLRLHPGKTDCLILDVAGASDDKSIQSLPVLFGLGSLLDGETVTEAREREAREQAARDREQMAHQDREKAAAAERRRRNQRAIEFFSRETMNWTEHQTGRWTIPLNKTQTIALIPEIEDRYSVLLLTLDREHGDTARYLARGLDLGYAQGAAEETIRQHGSRLLASTAAPWRDEEVTPGQRRYLHRLGLPIPDTRGAASDLIDRHTIGEALERVEAALIERETATDPEEAVPA